MIKHLVLECTSYEAMVNIKSKLSNLFTSLTTDPIKSIAENNNEINVFVVTLKGFVTDKLKYYEDQIENCASTSSSSGTASTDPSSSTPTGSTSSSSGTASTDPSTSTPTGNIRKYLNQSQKFSHCTHLNGLKYHNLYSHIHRRRTYTFVTK